jgi:hypothetical protein
MFHVSSALFSVQKCPPPKTSCAHPILWIACVCSMDYYFDQYTPGTNVKFIFSFPAVSYNIIIFLS